MNILNLHFGLILIEKLVLCYLVNFLHNNIALISLLSWPAADFKSGPFFLCSSYFYDDTPPVLDFYSDTLLLERAWTGNRTGLGWAVNKKMKRYFWKKAENHDWSKIWTRSTSFSISHVFKRSILPSNNMTSREGKGCDRTWDGSYKTVVIVI